jgi:acetyl-CoA carboxylase biotin carboxyl carrier protein
MKGTPIPLLVAKAASSGTILRAPMVGLWSAAPANGTVVEPGSPLGTLSQLGRRFDLVVPDGVAGRVAIEGRPHDGSPVQYGQTLARVTPLASLDAGQVDGTVGPSGAAKGVLTVSAPTDGVFYRAPAFDAKPYVGAGDRVTKGQPIGLIEVMKTFNPIAYGGAGLPDEAEVVEVVAADGQEVRAGQALVVVRTL